MKQEIADLLLLVSYIMITLCVIVKFVLWLRLSSPKRIGFLKSFAVVFSKNDIYDASSKKSRQFLYWSNVINFFLWVSILFLLIAFVLDTSQIDDNIKEAPKRKKGY